MRVRGWMLGTAVFSLFGLPLINALRGESGAPVQQAQGSDLQSQQLIRSVQGRDLFKADCAACHGKDGKGNGPAAVSLKAKVPDLTGIATRNEGTFPASRIRRIIMGEGIVASHGSREMPVWGPIFHQVEVDADLGNIRLENLVKYLESIQTVEASKPKPGTRVSAESVPSGEKLYKQNCAACHGNDLKGNGPAPPPFEDVPPDLTTLARRHGGKFPNEYVSEVLRNGVVLPAHGPAEMPTWGLDFRARDKLDSAQVAMRITNLSNYIKSLQVK